MIVMIGYAVWHLASFVTSKFHWPSWAPAAIIAAALYVLWTAHQIGRLISTIRKSREKRELATMTARYPQCNVVRLHSGEWFLVDKETGREFCPSNGRDGQA
ncbi:hypothetical protein [Paraburkholderia sp. RAU2J]|uniref:hypothetical protein n=1 Tax=Paraburkholderia sp. RAU2J TaxID=1938810 RepID=UPI000EB0014A|nr:hypothetical protein [Paraburkholderia sp. RAU2J]